MKTCAPGLMIFLLFIMVIMSVPGSAYGRISLKERDALEALYNKTGGKNWDHKENWKKAPGTESSWPGITLDADNTTVIKIELPDNNLQGVLPADMVAFSNLVVLDLSNNQLNGDIPHWIEKLKNLKTLNLSKNNFKGPIPAWLGNLKDLEELLLDNNGLEGPIPGEVGDLCNLKVLRIGSNRLTGEIPAALGKLVNLEDNRSDFKWNGLYTPDGALKDFLQRKQMGRDWESTQTVPPGGINVIGFTENSITIGWIPIPYTADKGGYRVFYKEASQQDYDYKSFIATKGKAFREVTLKDLKKGVKYLFKILTWTESHSNNKNETESVFSDEYPAATGGIIISGTITDIKNGEGFPGAQLTASNGGGTAETDKDGKYRLNVMTGWTGKITPDMKGFKFSPLSMEYNAEITKNISGNDYTVESDTVISGRVTFKGNAVKNVTLNFEGENGKHYRTSTDKDGNYNQKVSYGWSGSVFPNKDRHGFAPPNKKYEKVEFSSDGQNYEVQLQKIFGRVKIHGNKGVCGLKLEFTDMETDTFYYLKDSVITDKDGKYENFVLESWQGRVTLDSSQNKNFQFAPPHRLIMTPEAVKKAQNFRAWRNFKFFISITGNIMGHIYYLDIVTIHAAIEAGYKLSRFFFLWSRFYCKVKNLKTEVFNESRLTAQCLSIGIGFSIYEFIKTQDPAFDMNINVGIVRLRYKYHTENSVSPNILGVILEADYIINISDQWFTEIPIFYIFSKKNYMSSGLGMGLGLGYRF